MTRDEDKGQWAETADEGVVKNRGKIWIWYSDDAARVPVQMRARLSWGTLTFSLLRIENVRPAAASHSRVS